MSGGVLRAYYDLAVAPVTYDIFTFIYTAEIERIRQGLDAIDFLVVANTGDGFREDASSSWEIGEKNNRLKNIILRAGDVLPTCRGTIYYSERDHAKLEFDSNAAIYPAGYTPDNPVAEYADTNILIAQYAGKRLGTLQAPEQALLMIDRWLGSNTEARKPIVVTLRHCEYHPMRNSNISEFVRFAQSVDPRDYCVIFVPDTADAFKSPTSELNGFLQFDPAAISIDLRLALYERAYLNLFVDSGPASLCMLDERTRCIRFKMMPELNPNVDNHFLFARGYERGMQWANCNTLQRTVWEPDDFEVIKREVDTVIALIEAETQPTRLPLPDVRGTVSRLIAGKNFEHAITLASHELSRRPEDTEIRFLLAKAQHGAGKYEKAIETYERLLTVPGTLGVVAVPLAVSLWRAGRVKEAVGFLSLVVDRDVDNRKLTRSVADFFREIGEDDRAIALLERLLQEQPTDIEATMLLAGCFHHDNSTVPKAISLLAQALEHIKDESFNNLRMLADLHAAIGRFEESIEILERNMPTDIGDSGAPKTIMDHAQLGLWKLLIGDRQGAEQYFLTAMQAIQQDLERHDFQQPAAMDLLSLKARLQFLIGRHGEADETISAILQIQGERELSYKPELHLGNTPGRIEKLREIVGNRDVFIFCHGPSISSMDTCWPRFATHAPCLFSLNRFRVFESGFLSSTGDHLDVGMITHYRGIQQNIDQITGFLDRDENNLLITSRWVLDRLGSQCPTRQELEARFDSKLLYFAGTHRLYPASPDSPLRFILGNTLSVLVNFAVIAQARRIFLFGADGGVRNDKEEDTHYGSTNPDFRLDIDDERRAAITAALNADALMFDYVTEFGLTMSERLFNVERPPIYNVSPGSTLTPFPRIDYAAALEILDADTVDIRQTV